MDIKQSDIELEDRVLSGHERFENWLLKRYKTITTVTCGIGIAAGSFGAYNLEEAVYYVVKEGDPRESVSENPAFKKEEPQPSEEDQQAMEEFYKSMQYSQIGFYLMCGSLFLSTLFYYEGRMIKREEESNSE